MRIDRFKSLQQLDGEDWGEPTWDSQPIDDPLITECYRLHRVPLKDFTVEDLRIMTAMEVGPEYLIPMALERLQDNPVAGGAHPPYDLLVVVLRTETRIWQSHPELRDQLVAVADRAISVLAAKPDAGNKRAAADVTKAYEEFKRKYK